ncbi:MAG TPA: BamA/TamA family outer membrane protein [Salinimicrobium sp.]|nr:BamA/TamA family outer membrane protein [Salinimicrobium sp.]
MKKEHLVLFFLMFYLMQSCSVRKYIPEDELLYSGAELKIDANPKVDDIKELRQQLEQVLLPKPNDEFLGIPIGLYYYYRAKNHPNFINKFFNSKIGEEPVYLSEVSVPDVEELLSNRLENSGFFYSTVSSDIKRAPEQKTAFAVYSLKLRVPYTVAGYSVDIEDSLSIAQEIKESHSASLIQDGMRFDLTTMKAERVRIDERLKQAGYYNFQPQLLLFEADTNQYDQRKFDLFLRLKKGYPRKAVIPYIIETINVYPSYDISNDSIIMDTIRYDNMNFIRSDTYFKPKRLAPYILLEEGELYDPVDSRYTGRRLSTIGSYQYVNIRHEVADTIKASDTIGRLVTNIYLSPMNRRAIRAELQLVSKSNNFAGPGLAVTYSNRNLFHGGELLNITGRFSYESQVASGNRESLSSILFGLQTDLIIPRLVFPIPVNNDWFRYSIPKTKISLGGDYLNRSNLYSLGSVFGSFGYFWDANRFVTHELNPISVNYVSLTNTTPEFQDILKNNPFLQQSFNQEFISGLTYRFTYNEMGTQKTHQFFINANLDLAGNLLNLFAKKEEDGSKSVFGLEFAQYAKTDVDMRYHFNFGSGQTIATRLFAGIGIPYGNSEIMPYAKQYYSGGPYSVRAFEIRSLGPGTYSPEREESTAAYFDQTGNIRLEANIEYRFPLFSFFNGAFFADAGNVWNTESVASLPGGEFSSDFLSELGIGIGTGLRADIQNFVIRVDLAFPMHDPSLPPGERWVYDFGSPVLNFGIGYPF